MTGEMREMTPEELLHEIVRLKDELETSGASLVIKQVEALTKILKERMMRDLKDRVIDEVSGKCAEIEVRTKTVYDLDKFILTVGEKSDRYVSYQIDADALKRGFKNGDLSEEQLKASGAITKVPNTAAIYIRNVGEEIHA